MLWHELDKACGQSLWKFSLKSLTTNLPISPSVIQHRSTETTILGNDRNSIANALGSFVSIFTIAIVRDAVLHENVFIKHFHAVFHLGILHQIGAHKIGFLFNARLACSRSYRLQTWNALLFVLVHVQCTPRVNKRWCHLINEIQIEVNKMFC